VNGTKQPLRIPRQGIALAVSPDLAPGAIALVDQQNMPSDRGRGIGRGQPGRPTTHHDHVESALSAH
jgi:hypothetical protein